MRLFDQCAHRDRQAELMDDPGIDEQQHRLALDSLARLNALSTSANILWSPIKSLAKELDTNRLRVLDIATGSGDIPLSLWKRAARVGLKIDIQAVDISSQALDIARQRAEAAKADIRFLQCNVLDQEIEDKYDVVTSSLFLHHLDRPEAIVLLNRMANATRHLGLVNDLERRTGGVMLAYVATRLFSRSKVVHTDAILSVKAAFTVDEALALANDAGLVGATVDRRWPYRYLLSWRRT